MIIKLRMSLERQGRRTSVVRAILLQLARYGWLLEANMLRRNAPEAE